MDVTQKHLAAGGAGVGALALLAISRQGENFDVDGLRAAYQAELEELQAQLEEARQAEEDGAEDGETTGFYGNSWSAGSGSDWFLDQAGTLIERATGGSGIYEGITAEEEQALRGGLLPDEEDEEDDGGSSSSGGSSGSSSSSGSSGSSIGRIDTGGYQDDSGSWDGSSGGETGWGL